MINSKRSLVKELEDFYKQLKFYRTCRVILSEVKFDKQKHNEMMKIRETLVRDTGKFRTIITDLTGADSLHIVGKGPEYSYDMWGLALRAQFNSTTSKGLNICIDNVNEAIGKLTDEIKKGIRDKHGNVIGEPPKNAAELPVNFFDKMKFHPRVIEVSENLFKTGNYAQAIFEAFKAVNNYVKEKTGLTLDGTNLMEKVFNENKPILQLNELLDKYDKDEQTGFKFLFMGSQMGIRNPKAHKNVKQEDPRRTLEYLSIASLLMRRVDESKLVKLNIEKQKA